MARRGAPPPLKHRKDMKSIREEVEWAFRHKGGGRWLASLADDPKTLPLFIQLVAKVMPSAIDVTANVNVVDLGLALEQASNRLKDITTNTLTPETLGPIIEHVTEPDTLTPETLEPDDDDGFEVLG